MKDKILQALEQADGYLSGQELSGMLGVSRTAVWKAIEKLREEGYQIEAVTKRGYRLVNAEGTDILNQLEIEKRLTTKWAGRPTIYEKETGSTNDDIMKLADSGAADGTLVVSSKQTAGKGRRGRVWVSPSGGNIYMSLLVRPRISANIAPMSTLVMALATYEAMLDLDCGGAMHGQNEDSHEPYAAEHPAGGSIRFGIKWPNDIVVSVDSGPYKKFVGILTEMRLEDTAIKDVTIGIGLDLNQESVAEEFSETATTLSIALGHKVNRAEIAAGCWNHFEPDYEAFLKAGDLSPLQEEYNRACVNVGRRVRVLDPKGEFTGTAKGILPDGRLIVTPDGASDDGSGDQFIESGEISVRGVMGYV